jgi:hypothetical protein
MRMNFEHAAGTLLERHRTEMAAYGEQKFAEARDFHSRELAAAVEAARIERDDQVRGWYERLAHANEESLQKYEDQLHGASELWVNVAVDKLNDSGQAALASLTRSSEQALRNSLLKALEEVTDSVRQSIADGPAREPGRLVDLQKANFPGGRLYACPFLFGSGLISRSSLASHRLRSAGLA